MDGGVVIKDLDNCSYSLVNTWLRLLLASTGGNVSPKGNVKSEKVVALTEAFGNNKRSVTGEMDALENISSSEKWLFALSS